MTLQFSSLHSKSFLDIPLISIPSPTTLILHMALVTEWPFPCFLYFPSTSFSFHFASHFIIPREVHTFLYSPLTCQSSPLPLWLYMYMCPMDVSNHTPKISQQLNQSYGVFSTSRMLRCSFLNLPCGHFWKTLVLVADCINNCLCSAIIFGDIKSVQLLPFCR